MKAQNMNAEITLTYPVVIALVVGVLILLVFVSKSSSKPSTTNKSSEHEDISTGLRREEAKQDKRDASQSSNDSRTINPAVFTKFPLLKVRNVSHNTKLLRFEIPHAKSLDLPIGRHLSIRAEIDGNKVIRAYTPTSRPDQRGYFELLVKKYELGKMSIYLNSLKPGALIEVRGPVGRFHYSPNCYKHMGLIAGGSGLTPCLQVVRCLLEGEQFHEDKSKLTLLFQNRTKEDILLKEELDELHKKYSPRLTIVYFLSNCYEEDWGKNDNNCKTQGFERKGYINHAAMDEWKLTKEHCDFVGICGPSGFNEAMKTMASKVGHDEKEVYVW